jgi:type VI secretion system protein VasD
LKNNDFLHANPRVRHWRRAACAAFALLAVGALLTACGSKPPKPEPARLRIVAGADANPDSSGRPSPVVVRVFQLRADGEFAAADFFALYDKEKETLGQSLIARQEYVLVPGETRQLELSLDPQARYVGAVAAFRDIRSARWRVLTRAPEKKLTDLFKKDGVTISVEKDSLTLSAQH